MWSFKVSYPLYLLDDATYTPDSNGWGVREGTKQRQIDCYLLYSFLLGPILLGQCTPLDSSQSTVDSYIDVSECK